MSSNPATELASAIQSVHLNRAPSPEHDINPSTAASRKIPAEAVSPTRSFSSAASSTIPSDIIQPRPRRKSFPPIPDFRFEQSYLASIKSADTNWRVAFITLRDQVVLPLVQGVLWNLAMFGWRHWNRASKFHGSTVGSKVRKWWWGVNNWKLPAANREAVKKGEFSRGAEDFYVDKFGSSMGD